MALSNYLRMHRRKRGLFQEEVAFLLDDAHGSKVSKYERGERFPSLRMLFAYEVIFGVLGSRLYRGVFLSVLKEVQDRARQLMREIDQRPDTKKNQKKRDFLVDVVYRKPPVWSNKP